MKKISVIIPVYNKESYISRCLDSVLNQKLDDFECILIDDGSTDRSGVICDEYALKDDRIIVIHQDNKGVSSARNKGLEIAHGEYITFIDCDDVVSINFLDEAYSECKKRNLDIFASGLNYILQDSEMYKICVENNLYISNGSINNQIKKDLLLKNYISSPVAKLFKNTIVSKVRFDESYCYGEDLVFVYNVLKKAKRIFVSSIIYYSYYRISDSLMTSISINKCECVRKIARFLFEDCKNSYGDIKNEYGRFLRQRYDYDYKQQINIIKNSKLSLFETYKFIHTLCNDIQLRKELIIHNGIKWLYYCPLASTAKISIIKLLKSV